MNELDHYASDQATGGPTEAAVRSALERLLDSARFRGAPRVREFLEFVVTETLAGNRSDLKAYSIATGAFRYASDFDPTNDPYVRIVAGRVRRTLAKYYEAEGAKDPVRIEVPKGTYVPRFTRASLEQIVNPVATVEPTQTTLVVHEFSYEGQPGREWLASGLTEELIRGLGHLEELRVVGPLRGDTRIDSADFYLEGSIQVAGEQLRAGIRLADAERANRWADRFDAELEGDLFALQDDIARRTVGAIGGMAGAISRTLSDAARQVRPEEASSYEAVLKAYHWGNVLSDAAFRDASKALHAVVGRSPDYALARALLSDLYFSDWLSGMGVLEGGLDEAERLAREAVDLEPRSAQSRWSLGQVHFGRRRAQLMRSEYELAVDIAPERALTLASYAMWLVGMREWEFAAVAQRRARGLNPELPAWTHYTDFMLSASREEWSDALDAALRFDSSGLIWGPACRAVAVSELGDEAGLAAEIETLLEIEPDLADVGRERLGRLLWDPRNVAMFADSLARAGVTLA
ncbi:MAG: hypothetical protein GKS06_02345 [Acidobacteria bacterium]|nr:hypothetical protein [Acidobacteriota bacterium]